MEDKRARGTLTTQPTVAFEEILGDYKRNEQMIFSKLDQITQNSSGNKKGGGMGAAVEATEEIRKWGSKIQID